jgi:hypothetical protein
MSGTFFFSGAHVRGIIYLTSFKGDTTRGGPRLVGCGDVFTHFLITISLLPLVIRQRRQGAGDELQ